MNRVKSSAKKTYIVKIDNEKKKYFSKRLTCLKIIAIYNSYLKRYCEIYKRNREQDCRQYANSIGKDILIRYLDQWCHHQN